MRENFAKIAYGLESVKKALKLGAVETLLISDAVEDEIADELEEMAKQFNTNVKIISTETKEGVQLRDMGKIAAMLRYPLH